MRRLAARAWGTVTRFTLLAPLVGALTVVGVMTAAQWRPVPSVALFWAVTGATSWIAGSLRRRVDPCDRVWWLAAGCGFLPALVVVTGAPLSWAGAVGLVCCGYGLRAVSMVFGGVSEDFLLSGMGGGAGEGSRWRGANGLVNDGRYSDWRISDWGSWLRPYVTAVRLWALLLSAGASVSSIALVGQVWSPTAVRHAPVLATSVAAAVAVLVSATATVCLASAHRVRGVRVLLVAGAAIQSCVGALTLERALTDVGDRGLAVRVLGCALLLLGAGVGWTGWRGSRSHDLLWAPRSSAGWLMALVVVAAVAATGLPYQWWAGQ